jgi:Zn finger protein HypA/HybF involved in hydrogenase expression
MNLSEARLCLDCEEVFNSGKTICPKCAGKHSALIVNWLNRPNVTKITRSPIKCRCFNCGNIYHSNEGESLYFCNNCSKIEVWNREG